MKDMIVDHMVALLYGKRMGHVVNSNQDLRASITVTTVIPKECYSQHIVKTYYMITK